MSKTTRFLAVKKYYLATTSPTLTIFSQDGAQQLSSSYPKRL